MRNVILKSRNLLALGLILLSADFLYAQEKPEPTQKPDKTEQKQENQPEQKPETKPEKEEPDQKESGKKPETTPDKPKEKQESKPTKKEKTEPVKVQPPAFPGAALINSEPPFFAGVGVPSHRSNGIYMEGETIDIRFQSEKDSYLYLIYHDAEKKSYLLFPNVNQKENLVPAKETIQVPAPGGNFRFRVKAPFGNEVLQVLASTKPIEELDKLFQDANGTPQVSQVIFDALAVKLKEDPKIWTENRLQIQTIPKQEEPPPRKTNRIGLFIGIGKYKNPKICATHVELGNSARVMAQAMTKRGGLDPQMTKLIMDEQATKENIKSHMLEWLPSVSKPGDTVFIYFSGHSGSVPAIGYDESDGKDELLCPYELEAGGSANLTQAQRDEKVRASGITDDTMGRWLQALPGRQIVLILDTCMSGGMVSEKGFGDVLQDEAVRLRDISGMNMIIMTSTNADEEALFEGTPNKTMYFTYVLAHAIEKHARPLTMKDAYIYSLDELKKLLRARKESRTQRPTYTDTSLLPVYLVP